MKAINIIFNDKKEQYLKLLQKHGFKKIGHNKKNSIAFCVIDNQFFEVSSMNNPYIDQTTDINDVLND